MKFVKSLPFLLSLFLLLAASGGPCVHAEERVIQGVRTPVSSLDPFATTGIEGFAAMANVVEPLFRLHPSTGQLMPALALSYRLDPKHNIFTVKLRPNVKFHNGDRFTAEDVQFTFEAYRNPKYQAQIWQGMWSEVESVKAKDPLTAEFKLKSWRYPYFLGALTSLRILPKKEYLPEQKKFFREKLIGTGPFMVENFEANRKLDLKPNPEWWGEPKPQFKLTLRSVQDAQMAEQLMKKNQLDFYAFEPSELGARQTKYASGLGQGFWIDLNFKNRIFHSRKVREALLLLWDRQNLNKKIFNGEMQPALDIFSPNTSYFPKGEPAKYDPEKAAQLLKEEGWEDRDRDGIRDKDNRPLRFTILTAIQAEERWLTLYQQEAKKLGVQIKIERLGEDAQWIDRLKSGNYDAYAGSGALINEPAKYSWATDGVYNYSKYSNKEVDRLTEELDLEFNPEIRRLKMRKLIEILRQDLPQIPGLNTSNESYLVSDRLKPDPEDPKRAWKWRLH